MKLLCGLKFLFVCFLSLFFSVASAQVKVRLFSLQVPELIVFSVTYGLYEVDTFKGEVFLLFKGEPLIITRYNNKLAVKPRNQTGFICDSIRFSGKTGDDYFSLMTNGKLPVRQNYSDDLECFADMETLVLINNCNIEKYIAGVVRAEGGTNKNIEYFKSQAVIARTYMYKYFDKHLADRYNVCDNTHCQAFNGLSTDSVVNLAVSETRGLVILAPDSSLIIAAFHSNCGGETCSSEDVWLTSQPYLKKVIDPYCLSSLHAKWEKSISLKEWSDYIKKSGYNELPFDPKAFNFVQNNRLTDYKSGLFTLALRSIRAENNLKSTFFSVVIEGDSVKLKGRGYGHGVGLCQEGSMVMAEKGFNYKQIINFYYQGVIISDIKNAVILPAGNSLNLSQEIGPQAP